MVGGKSKIDSNLKMNHWHKSKKISKCSEIIFIPTSFLPIQHSAATVLERFTAFFGFGSSAVAVVFRLPNGAELKKCYVLFSTF